MAEFDNEIKTFIDRIGQKIDLILKNQEQIEKRLSRIESDIYLDDGFDLEILCPYCNNEFIADMDEDCDEIVCPECKNVIELDWTGNIDEEFGCNESGCTNCQGCGHMDIEDDDM